MKFLMLCAICVAVVSAGMDPEMKKQMMDVMMEIATNCAAKENANPDELSNLMAKKVPTTREGRCLLACFNEHIKMQTPDGKMDLNGAMNAIEVLKDGAPAVHESMAALFRKCFPETDGLTDRCDVAGKFAECATAAAEELGLEAAML